MKEKPTRIGRPPRARWPEVPEAMKRPRRRLSHLDRVALDLMQGRAVVVTAQHNGGEPIAD